MQWVAAIGSFCSHRGAGVTISSAPACRNRGIRTAYRHYPAVPRMRLEQNAVIGLVGDIAVLFAILVVQGHLASAADDVKNVCLFRWSLVKCDRAVGVDMPRITLMPLPISMLLGGT